MHATRPRDPQTDPGEERERERVWLLREERPLRVSADRPGGVFGQSVKYVLCLYSIEH